MIRGQGIDQAGEQPGVAAVGLAAAADQLNGGTGGNDTLAGEDGDDLYVFDNASFGNDVIEDFVAGAGTDDVIDFSALSISFGDLNFFDSGGNLVITITGGGTESLTLQGLAGVTLDETDDFIF